MAIEAVRLCSDRHHTTAGVFMPLLFPGNGEFGGRVPSRPRSEGDATGRSTMTRGGVEIPGN